MTTRLGWNELLFALLLAAAASLGYLPAQQPRTAVLQAVVVGGGAGCLLFVALAGRAAFVRRRLRPPLPRRRSLGGSLVLLGRAVGEEVAWRGFLLGAVERRLPPLVALAATSALFAAAHANVRGPQRLVHVATGLVFGGVYLLTGRLAAAVAAHAAYNGLVAMGRRSWS